MKKNIEWQVTYKNESFPFFSQIQDEIDMFENESDAQEHAETLSKKGRKDITLTKIVDTAPSETWKLIDNEWI